MERFPVPDHMRDLIFMLLAIALIMIEYRLQDEMIGIKELADQRDLELQQQEAVIEQYKLDTEQLRIVVKENATNLDKFRRVGDELRIKNDDYERRLDDYGNVQARLKQEKVRKKV